MIKSSGSARRARQEHLRQQQEKQQEQLEDQRRRQREEQAERLRRLSEQLAAAGELPQPEKPQSVADVRRLLEKYGSSLTEQNRTLIGELVTSLEQGADRDTLVDLASRMNSLLHKQTP